MPAAKKKKTTTKAKAKAKKTKKKAAAKKTSKTTKATKKAAKKVAKKTTTKSKKKAASKKVAKKTASKAKSAASSAKKTTKKKASAKKATKATKATKKTAKKTTLKKKAAATTTTAKPTKKVSKKVAAAKPEAKTAKKVTKKATKKKMDPKVIAESLNVAAEQKPKVAEVLLTDAEGRVLCRFTGCDAPAVVESYCRYHYLLNWKKIQLRKKILAEGKLENYINELTARYPDKYLEMMKNDLKSEKDFLAAVQELEIDDPDAAMSDADAENYLEEVRGIRGDGRSSSDDDY